MVSISPDRMSCNEDFDVEAAAEMMHTDDIRSFEETPMEQDTPYMAECICCVDNVHHEVLVDQLELNEMSATSTQQSECQVDKRELVDLTPIIAKAPLSRHVTFDLSEISATSTQHSEYQLDMHEPVVLSPIIRRRSSRIKTQKRKSSEMAPDPVNTRKRKSNGSPGSAPKIRRTNSLDRASKSPANAKEINQKVAKKRISTGSTGRPRRQSGKFNKH